MPSTSPNGTPYCRTCGFADCPGAHGGDCPRWPARGERAVNSDLEYLLGRARTLAAEMAPDTYHTPEQLAYWAGQARYVLGQLAEVAGHVNA